MNISATAILVGGLSIKDNMKNDNQVYCKKCSDLINLWPTRSRIRDKMVKGEFLALTLFVSGISVSDTVKSPARSVITDSLLVVTELSDRSES